ncbi:MAG: tetratricopeptide repeat protein [Planctomycetes bacterium]|nr:tetratricopeptide repeat protein [Planctomycetota bacterium]
MKFRNLLSVACLLIPLALNAATNAERMDVHRVDLRTLSDRPSNYDGLRVQFRAIFVERGDLFYSFHTQFRDVSDINLVLWDDQDDIWVPETRAKAIGSAYFNKRRARTSGITELKKYQPIDVIGQVVSSYGQTPWIDIHSITLVDDIGRYSDASVFLLQQGAELAEKGSYALADQNFESALASSLATDARIAALELRATNLLNWGKFKRAVEVTIEALALHGRWQGDVLPTKLSQLHYLAAKGYSESAAYSQAHGDDAGTAEVDFQKSIDHAQLSVTLDPDNGDAFAILGIGLSGLEKYDEARVHCQRAILMRPSNATIRWYLGRILDRQGEYEEAISVLNRAIDLSPKDYRIHKTIAMVYLHRSDANTKTANTDRVTALREFDIAIRLNNADADLFYFSGLVIEKAALVKQKVRIGKAYTLATAKLASGRFHKCVDVDDTYLVAVRKLADYYRGIKKHDEAVGFFKRALELDPANEELYADLGVYFTELGKLVDAYDVYAAYQLRQPKHLDTLYALGKLSLDIAVAETDAGKKQETYKRGIAWHENLVRIENKHAMGHADLTEMYVEVGDWRNAVKHGDIALAELGEASAKTRVYRNKAIAHWAMDEVDNTIGALATQSEGSKDMRVISALGWSLSTKPSKAVDALATAKIAVALDGKSADAQELLGWAQYLNADYAAAEKTLSTVGGLGKELKGYRLGMAIYQQGAERYADAKELLKAGAGLRDKRSILRNAGKEVSLAQRAIRDYDKGMQRKNASNAKAAAAKAKKDAVAKKSADDKAKRAAAEKAKQDSAAKRAADEKAKRDAAIKAKQAAADKKAAAEKSKKDAAAKAKADKTAKKEAKKAADKKAKADAARKKAAIEKAKRDAAKRKAAEEAAKKK